MKIKIFITFLSICSFGISYSQTDDPPEIYFSNHSNNPGRAVQFKIYPVSMVFNGDKNYNLKARLPDNQGDLRYHYISGAYLVNGSKLIFTEVPSGSSTQFGPRHDRVEYKDGSEGCIGFGIYKVEISVVGTSFFDTVTVEYDYGYPNSNLSADLELIFRNDNNGIGGSGERVNYTWSGSCSEQSISSANRKLEAWNQCSGQTRTKELNFFIYDNSNENSYNLIPLDARRDCNVISGVAEQNQEFYQERNGLLSGYLSIRKDINTPSNFYDPVYQQYFSRNITIIANAQLNVYKGSTLTLNQYDSLTNAITVDVLSNGALTLTDSANYGGKIIIKPKSTLKLNTNSKLYIGRNSEILVQPGGIFCNYGASIRGAGRIIYKGGTIHQTLCAVSDYLLQDSIKLILDSNAVVSIPNNTTLHLRGSTTSLILKPGSKLLFGENSGIVCDSGARLVAHNATFASIDSTKKWNGISLKHRSHDTIKNCTIKNAYSGITIFNKNDDEETEVSYSTVISGCTFVNQTNYVLNSGIYVANSDIVLIKNNTFTSNALTKGYTHGIYAEYSTGGWFNIIGNTISNSGNGMTLINSSPFVAQNVLNGNEYAESGLFLDNVNGKFEYNVINDFYYSYYSFTSSPDLLKNTFNNSYDENIYLSYSSVPNMHPVESDGSMYWFSGDNHITGSPSDAGILFDEDAYPNMAYGYNRFTMTNNTYYINGNNPTNLDSPFDVRKNYWGTASPDPNKINVINAIDVFYNPYDDNSSTPRATNNYILYGIGFELYDTVFFNEPDNPGMVQEFYLEAYQKEYSGEFEDAIEIYKEIVSDYKDSSNATSCLSRIFNCYEKKNSNTSEYSSLQSYFTNIFNDTSYSETQRNLSEDFLIKCKVKQNNIEEAISDYNTIYNNNQNTAKGIHALINKEILSAGSGDNLGGNDNIELRQNRINEILNSLIQKRNNVLKNINTQAESFSLQNHPNPFNPITKINFQLPTSGNVKLKIYDITGKEVATLINEFKQSGRYSVAFDASNLSSGVYYYRIESGNIFEIKKMILIK